MCALCVCFVPSIGAVVAGAIRSGLNMSHANAKCRGKPSRSDKATASGGGAKGGVSMEKGEWAVSSRALVIWLAVFA